MKIIFSSLISLCLLTTLLFGQSSERPETIVIPVYSLGEVSEVRKQILQNTLEDELKSHFRLISQERFEEVQEKVFEELEYDECTEEQCIVMIQEMLQVENVFHLQILGEGDDTQLSLSWRTLDEKRKETDYCEECKTKELNKRVVGLVGKLVGKSVIEKPSVVIDKSSKKILFKRRENGVLGWFKDGNEKTDGRYFGETKKGLPNGKGTYSHPNGEKYEGEWKEGEFDGKGTLSSSNSIKYEGEWKEGRFNGKGTYIYWDGDKYEGDWVKGLRVGRGILTWKDGDKFDGEFKNDKVWNGIIYDKNRNITGKYVDGKWRRN